MTGIDYDLVVIGSGPAGQKGAIAAAKLGKRVAVVDRRPMIGGGSLHTGTIPSKSLREAILYLSGLRQRAFYGADYVVKEDISANDLMSRVRTVLERETEVVRAQLKRNGVVTVHGTGHFTDPHTIAVESDEAPTQLLSAQHVLVACGTRPAQSVTVPTDGKHVFNSDQLLALDWIPRDLIVVGAGVIGIEYASMFTALNTKVTLIDLRSTLLDFVDNELIDALCYHMRDRGVTFRLGEELLAVELDAQNRVVAKLASGKTVHGDALLYTVGRQAATDILTLAAAGVPVDARGRIAVNERFQTAVEHIYAAGDVIGFPALASAAMEQGRLAALQMFGQPCNLAPELIPYGIYTIPEISMVGRSEEELTAAKVRYEVGISRFRELAKGQMTGDEIGLLKLLFDPETKKILGVHVIGDNATEIVHIGQAVLALNGTMEYFRDAVFNYPTLAEAYKVAALNGMNKL